MASKYKLVIVTVENERIAEFAPGLPVETNFIDDCVARTIKKGVGIWHTKNQVAKAVREGIEEAIYELKRKVKT